MLLYFRYAILFLILALPVSAQSTLLVPSQYLSIPAAVAASVNGDTILVSPGTWFGFVEFNGKAVTIKSTDGPMVTTIESTNTLSPICFIAQEGPGSVLDGFTLRAGTVSNGGAIFCSTNASPTIRNCVLRDNVAFNSGGGIYCGTNSSPTIENCVFYNNNSLGGSGGALFCGSGSNATLLNCTLTNNLANTGNPSTDTGGIFCSSTASITIVNTIVFGNSGLPLSDPSTISASHSIIEGGDGMGSPFPGTMNVDADPMLVNPANLEFRPSEGSPAVDAGDAGAIGLPSNDLFGGPRAVGAGPDIGALEFLVLYPGSRLDLELRSGVNATPDLVPVKSAASGDFLFFDLVSPSSTYTGEVPLVFIQLFASTSSAPGHPTGFPEIWVDVTQAVSVLYDGNNAPTFGLGILPPSGLSLGYLIPSVLAGISAHVQGLVFAPNPSNAFFTAANALRIDFI